jgi:uncharacterized membrane protein YdbT with pleckstrin-like domain
MDPKNTDQPQDYSQPVAYDKDGNPLYAHPPQAQTPPIIPVVPQVVQMTRAADPQMPHISENAKRRHEESKQKHPTLNLSEGEYIINEVRRHPIGLVSILSVAGVLILIVFGLIAAYPTIAAQSSVELPPIGGFIVPALLFIVLIALGGYITAYVYLSNKFFLTNESVIQEIQTSLFSRHEQTVSLASIEDASYRQQGIVQALFNYGSIRLSTEGEETTYRFYFVSNPKKQIATLNNAVEAFKNGRPVTGD